jgi:predicted AAA+ superfamily ATPase
MEQNKHWQENFFYNYSFSRDVFEDCYGLLQNKYITRLIGLRRVGKSTIMKQMIDRLIEKEKIPRKNILYFSFDIVENIAEVVKEYQKRAEISFDTENVYIFLDEIQKVKNWQSEIKLLYDIYPQLKIVLSGSASLLLQKTESLAGRIFTQKITPLSFSEYLRFLKKETMLDSPLLFEEKLQVLFESYIFRQFFDIVDSPIEEAKKYMEELQKKVIREDIPQYYTVEYPQVLEKIFRIISTHPGMILDYKNLSNDLKIDWRTLEKYISFLESSFLIRRVFNYSENAITSEKKMKKVYLESPSFSPQQEMNGELFENAILQSINTQFFYRKSMQEVDFVLHSEKQGKKTVIPLEIKWKNKLQKKDVRSLQAFQKKFMSQNGILISKIAHSDIENIEILPFWKVEKFVHQQIQ